MSLFSLAAALSLSVCAVDVREIPLLDPDARVFPVQIDADGEADLWVQSGRDVRIHYSNQFVTEFSFSDSDSAYDVYDIDADGASEVIVIEGSKIVSLELSPGEAPARQVLFEADSTYALMSGTPSPQVFVSPYLDAPAIVLPHATGVRIYRLTGELIEEHGYAAGDGTDSDRLYWSPSWVQEYEDRGTHWTQVIATTPRELPPSFPLESDSTQSGALINDLTNPTADSDFTTLTENSGPYAGEWYASLLRDDQTARQYVVYRSDGSGSTLVHLRTVSGDAGIHERSESKMGPIRRYPGMLFKQEDEGWLTKAYTYNPDFNGDGYFDLVLWDAPRPGVSIDSLVRTVVGRSWPVRIAIHLYVPDNARYDPKPAGMISAKGPINFFLNRNPVANIAMVDVDGDGLTDLGFGTEPNNYHLWLAADGFSRDPDWTHTFGEPIKGVEFSADLSGKGRTSILLRGEKNLYLLQSR
ncbi:MAG: hypothetical protein KJ060_01175 [Candidatus Hydrogenedentes bacterium]|nr:hypothetical protein [Candidatus Hydrogenedentota bacterium]